MCQFEVYFFLMEFIVMQMVYKDMGLKVILKVRTIKKRIAEASVFILGALHPLVVKQSISSFLILFASGR